MESFANLCRPRVGPAARTALAVLFFALPPTAIARTILVPAEQTTIQQAIGAAASGDVIQVAAGTYAERIDFLGKAITVESQAGPATTILDGGSAGPVVTFTKGEGRSSVLSGFTIQRGARDEGGGVWIQDASPTVVGNWIVDNRACAGAGVAVAFGSPLIEGNVIDGNAQAFCSGGIGGGGISVRGGCTAQIVGNAITGNSTGSDGGGISLFSAGAVTIRGNDIRGNLASRGGGVVMYNTSNHDVVGNLIAGNRALSAGGGIYWLVPVSAPRVVANTFADNDAPDGSAILADGYDGQAQIVGNIIVAKAGQTAVSCGAFNDPNPPILRFNDVYVPAGGTLYAGLCTDVTGTEGNISADPLFADAAAGDFRLTRNSPAIDSGTDAAPSLPALDRDGRPRIIDGDGDCTAAVDIGAYEFGVPAMASLSPATLDFGAEQVGRTTGPQPLTLANGGTAGVPICTLTVAGDYSHQTDCGSVLPAGASCSIAVRFSPIVAGDRPGSVMVQVSGGTAPHTAQLAGVGVGVLPPVTISPAAVTVTAGGSQAFTATGGTGVGYQWSLSQAPSGGSIDAAGDYRAGATASVTDVVQVQDSLGNVGTATVTVTAAVPVPAPPHDGGGCSHGGGGGAAWLGVALAWAAGRRRRG